ncbi:RDD family protein [Mycolicibacterium sp. 120266]|uniref:RDD family protein n=1 Tax=Mycolicibacterium sp. 120266 TaxID=3090601 RepID=UPI00299E2FB9|nr:RDD family protein [Mycolicibacterium sp. 120266]MDX1871312.1 RDD family protein [Mycolicibacterium sp. 120266]
MVSQPEPLVTGDAVVLEVSIAQLPVRAAAALIDLTVMLIGYVLGVTLWALTLADFDSALSAAVLIIFTVLTLLGYPVVFETATRGRSLGKMALGLRVVSDDGGPERLRQAIFRALAGVIEIWMFTGAPAVLCSMVSPRGKRIGDVFAGTMVISERTPRLNPPPPMPPALAGWAGTIQLSGLGSAQAEMARQFLSRTTQLDPRMREQMAHRIAAEVLARIAPPPPPGAPPELVLAAVLAERHRRELERLRVARPEFAPASPPPPARPGPAAPPTTSGFTPPS